MDKRKRAPWKLSKDFYMDIIHEVKSGAGVNPATLVTTTPLRPPPPPPSPFLALVGLKVEFTTPGLSGIVTGVRSDDDFLLVKLPFGLGYIHPSSLLRR